MLALLIFSTLLLFALNFLIAWGTRRIGTVWILKNPHLRLSFYLLSGLVSVLGLMQAVANTFASKPQFLSQSAIDTWSSIAFIGSLLSYAAGMLFSSRQLPEETR